MATPPGNDRSSTRDIGAPGPTDGHAITQDDLRDLVLRARDGDERSWEVLFRRAYPKLLAYASRRLASRELAMDAVGETMTRAVANIDRFRSEGGGFDAWLYGIIRHVVVDAQRSLSREGPGPIPDLPDAGPQPGDRVLSHEGATEMRAAFEKLNASDQELLELRVVAALSADETASVLGRRPGAVRMAQSRALGRLRRLLADGDVGEGSKSA